MADTLERGSFCLRDFSRHSSPDVLFCNRGCHRLLGFSCGNRAFGLCHPGAEHRGLSLAGTREFALCNSGSLPVGEPALECSFAESAPGNFSPPGRHSGTRSLLSPQAIPPFRLVGDGRRRDFDSWDLDGPAMATRFAGKNRSVDRHQLDAERGLQAHVFARAACAKTRARLRKSSMPAEHSSAVKTPQKLLSMSIGFYISIHQLKIDPVWDPIRNDPGFQPSLGGKELVGPNKW